MSVAEIALDYAAQILAPAMGLEAVSRSEIAEEPAVEDVGKTGLVVALATGTWTEVGYCIGADRPHEFQHDAPLEILCVLGDATAQRERINKAIEDAKNAIAADTTLGGRVDYAELASPDPTDADRFVALAATLQLTFTAPDALG